MRPTLVNVKRAPLDSRNIHKIPPRNDSYLARAAIASSTARLIARASRSAPIFPTSRRRHADLAEPASEGLRAGARACAEKAVFGVLIPSRSWPANDEAPSARLWLRLRRCLRSTSSRSAAASGTHLGIPRSSRRRWCSNGTAPAGRKLVYKIVRARPDLLQRAGKIFCSVAVQ
jgi:hypothetical protein